MAKVFTTVPGSELRLGNYGLATNDDPAIVPDEAAEEFKGRPDLRVEGAPVVPRLPAKDLKASQPATKAEK